MASVQTTLPHTLSPAAAEQGQLPAGFPAVLDSNLAWIGADFKNAESYTYQLTDADIAEIDDAVKHFKCQLNLSISCQHGGPWERRFWFC